MHHANFCWTDETLLTRVWCFKYICKILIRSSKIFPPKPVEPQKFKSAVSRSRSVLRNRNGPRVTYSRHATDFFDPRLFLTYYDIKFVENFTSFPDWRVLGMTLHRPSIKNHCEIDLLPLVLSCWITIFFELAVRFPDNGT